MALQCVLGAGRTGKTDYIYQQMIKESMENRDENFFFLVPDQSTLNAQRVPKGSSRVRFRHGKAGLYR